MAKKKFNPAEEQAKLLKEAQSIGKALGMEYEDIAEIQEQILNRQIKSNQTLLESLKLAKQSADSYKQRARAEDDALRKQEDRLKLQKEEKRLIADRIKQSNQLQDLTDDLAKSIQGSQKTLFSNTEETYNAQKKLIKARKQEIAEARKTGEINSSVARSLYDQLNALDEQVDKTQQVQNTYQKQFETMTALGGFLKKNFGEVGEILEGSMNKGMEAFSAEIAASGDSTKASSAAMKAFGGEITAGLTKMFSLVGIATALTSALVNAMQAVREFATATGASIKQSEQLVTSAKNYASTSHLTLATSEKILDVQKQLIASFGSINSVSTETAAKVAQIGESFGYGAELAGQVQASMMGIGASAEDAMKIQGFTSALAEAAGVAPGAVMKDIAANAKTTAKYFAGNPKALAKAAVEAAKIGLSLSDMVSVADKLLDIESSLTSQFEASAMLGRQINMDKARQLALEGDIEGATKAAIEQVGTLAEFNNMSYIQKKKIAEAAGLEVGQIEKSLQLQEKMKGMSAEQQAAVEKYGDALGDVSKMSEDEILQRTTALQSADEMSATMDKLKETIGTALVPLAKIFAGTFQLISPILNGFLRPLNGIAKIFEYISSLITEATDKMSWLSTLATGIGYAFDFIGSLLGTVLVPLLGALAIKAAIGAASLLGQAISMIFNTFAMIPFGAGIPLAIAAAAGLVGTIASATMDDGVVEPGYGTRVLSTPEGSISLNNKDTVVAGTNLFDGNNPGNTNNVSTGKMEALLSELISLTRQSLTQPVPVVIGDKAINEIGKQYATNSTYKPAGSR